MSNTPLIFWLVPVASLIALGFAWHFFRSMMKESEGTPRMKEIAAHVRKGRWPTSGNSTGWLRSYF